MTAELDPIHLHLLAGFGLKADQEFRLVLWPAGGQIVAQDGDAAGIAYGF